MVYVGGGRNRNADKPETFFDLFVLDTTIINNHHFIAGTTFIDINGDGIRNISDTVVSGIDVIIYPARSVNSDANGKYSAFLHDSVYTVSAIAPPGYHISSSPSIYNVNLNGSSAVNLDFGITPDNVISGRTFIDLNNNGIWDSTDATANNMQISIGPTSTIVVSTNGRYFCVLPDSTYQISANIPPGFRLSSPNQVYTISVNGSNINNLDFGIYPVNPVSADVEPLITGGMPICNRNVMYGIAGRNTGISPANGIINLQLDSQMVFISSNPQPDSIVSNNYFWHYNNLQPFATEDLISMDLLTPGPNNSLSSIVRMTVLDSTGGVLDTSSNGLLQAVRCSYDPNEKQVNPAEDIPIQSESWLNYSLFFQNTGNAVAFNIVLRDTLDSDIDVSSLEVLESSHSYSLQIINNVVLVFSFNNILLADSNTNEPESHGYVKYRVKLKPGVPQSAEIRNTCYIYFDFNPPIVTNTTVSTFPINTMDKHVGASAVDVVVYPNPFNTEAKVKILKENEKDCYNIYLKSIDGRILVSYGKVISNEFIIDRGKLSAGSYLLELQNCNNNNGHLIQKVILSDK